MSSKSFDDVLLIPQYSDVESRQDLSTSSSLGRINLNIPIISSPMDTVTEVDMASALDSCGGLGVIHRYNSPLEQAKLVKKVKFHGVKNVGAAIGVTGDYLERAQVLIEQGVNVLCVDVAHGHHSMMKNALSKLREVFGNSVHIIADICRAPADRKSVV